MEILGTADEARASGYRIGNDIGEEPSNMKNVASAEIQNLIADVEDLVARIADLKDADVVRVRSKVLRAVGNAKESLAESADNLRRQAQQAARTADDFVHDSPWQAVGIAALVGAVAGILATRRS
ncbi:MAG: YqjD family protein [Steroidobacteraceae bacterium]